MKSRYGIPVSVLLIAASLFAVNLAAAESPLAMLKYKTAWVLLGDWDVNTRAWGTVTHHVVRLPNGRENASVPKVGDTIQITDEAVPLEIANYATDGERQRLSSMANRIGSKIDLTGLSLPPGSRVIVRAVARDRVVGELQGVWVRVVPVD